MSAKELINQEDDNSYSEEELEETLSLSDLVINDRARGDSMNDGCFSMERDQDFFEFYNQVDHHSSPNQSFIFCGKIIHCKQHLEDDRFHARVGKHRNKTEKHKYEWKPAGVLHKSLSTRRWRWYLFAFGAGRFPVEMGPEEMKMRQMRMQSPKAELSTENNVNDGYGTVNKRVNKGFLGWIRGFGCRDQFATAVVGCAPSSQFEQRT